MGKREFTVIDEYQYDRSRVSRWVLSHALRYPSFFYIFLLGSILLSILSSLIPDLTGQAFNTVVQPDASVALLLPIILLLIGAILLRFLMDFGKSLAAELLGKRMQRDVRDELYLCLLGKSQTFHNRQRVGDLMARMNDDVTLLSNMFNPGIDIIFNALAQLIIPLVFISLIRTDLLLTPVLFLISFLIALWLFGEQLGPVAGHMREQFGAMNARLAEALDGIEVVKASAQEDREQTHFNNDAGRCCDAFVKYEFVQARYLPPLLLSLALAGALLHGMLLLSQHQLSVGDLIAYLGLINVFAFPAYNSVFAIALIRLGVTGAARLLAIMHQETEVDARPGHHRARIAGQVIFDDVTFSHGDHTVLRNISFQAEAGQVIAIVGPTGSGKSTLTQLINRIYDVDCGNVLIDGVDVQEWDLDSLRSQIAIIEQDTLLFSHSIADNIAFGIGHPVERADIQRAAQQAQAHEFISSFPNGYDTVIGERGITLSGGQRQRLAIARALLSNPRILILDDSTSAIDSMTELEIQKALGKALQERTTFLITHRLSQIRWADKILVLKQGVLVAQGTHEELLASSEAYQRIFARGVPIVAARVDPGAVAERR